MDGTGSFSKERPTAGPSYSSNDVYHFSTACPSYGIEENEWRILLIGKTGVGKSATGNNILGTKIFTSQISAKSVTQKSQIGRADRFGKKILLVDTPGIFDTRKSGKEVLQEIVKCIGITSPGLHAIILVVHIGRFTEEEKKTVDIFLDCLGQQLIQFLVIVFTRKDDIDRENISIDEYVDSLEPSSMLSEIIEKSGRRYVAFDNTAGKQQNEDQVKRLFSLIENLIRENGGRFYTNDMYQEAEMAFKRRIDEERNRLEKKKREEIEAILAPYKAEIEEERRERESLSLELATTKEQTASLVQDKTRIEATLKETIHRVEREAIEKESEIRRIKEEGKKDREINERRLGEIKEDVKRREEERRREDERRRENDLRQRQIEDDRRRDREESDRRFKRDQEELEKRLSQTLAIPHQQTVPLFYEKSKMEAEREISRRVEKEYADRERRMEEERRKEHELNERRMIDITEDLKNRVEEGRREFDKKQRQIEDDRRREREESDRRLKQDRKELEKRLSEEHKKQIAKVKEEYDKEISKLRETGRDDVQKEKSGFFGTIVKVVSKVPFVGGLLGTFVGAIGETVQRL